MYFEYCATNLFFDNRQWLAGPAGKYRLQATFDKGAAAAGQEIEFHVFDTADMHQIDTEVVVGGDAPQLEQWLEAQKIPARKFNKDITGKRKLILVSQTPQEPGGRAAFKKLLE